MIATPACARARTSGRLPMARRSAPRRTSTDNASAHERSAAAAICREPGRGAATFTGAMKLLRVAAATLNQTPLDWDGNRTHIISAIEEARAERVSVLCLPELCISGYGCEDAFLAPGTQAMALAL